MSTKSMMSRLSFPMILITVGIVFGDIGTSPLYVMSSVIGDRMISKELIYGSVSCVFWTLTLITSFKYVFLALRADNNGEGGVFALYALVRKRARWLVIPALIGGAASLSDGIITPAISVSSAVEGLKNLNPDINTIPIVVIIIAALFLFQRAGTKVVGNSFGPIMLIWFLMLGILGVSKIVVYPQILHALNPLFAIRLLATYPDGYWLLGAVFLCTTGADALYSDMGHCGKKNIRTSWIYVKVCLLLNYFGQGAWLMQHIGKYKVQLAVPNPFYGIMPDWFLLVGIGIATMAAIIASQAMITGSFTLINEAMRLNLWPKSRIIYPTDERGQIYIPSLNWLLFAGCMGIIYWFGESANMEAAYGLAINITMIVTTTLLSVYAFVRRGSLLLTMAIAMLFLTIDFLFLIANLAKFPHGGYVAILVACFFALVMFVWYKARKIRNRFLAFGSMKELVPQLVTLSEDQSIPKFSSHLVFLTSSNTPAEIETKFHYSIFRRQPKRADTYWFVHVDVMDEPYTSKYELKVLVPNIVYRIDFHLGFRIEPSINVFLRKVIEDMMAHGEVDITSRYESLSKRHLPGNFQFVVLERYLSYENDLPIFEKIVMDLYFILKSVSLSEGNEFGLESSVVTIEKIPLLLTPPRTIKIEREEEETDSTGG